MSTTTTNTGKTLADVLSYAGSNRYFELRAKRALNLGSDTMITTLDLGTFLVQSRVGNDPLRGEVTQRKPDMAHAKKMASFIFKGLVHYVIGQWEKGGKTIPGQVNEVFKYLGKQVYYAWAPIVVSIRDDLSDILVQEVPASPGELILKLRSNQSLWVVDGQHRRIAWDIVWGYLKQLVQDRRYSKSGGLVPTELKLVSEEDLPFWHEALAYFTEQFSITLDIHFGLTIHQERQLFHDLNNLQKTVGTSLAQAFDQSNPINIFTHRLKAELLEPEGVVVSESSKVDWSDDAWMKLDSLNSINARLFLNKTTISDAKLSEINEREEDAWAFWTAVTKIPGVFDRNESVAAQPSLLKCVARVYYEILWGRKADGKDAAESFLERLPTIDFSHSNPLWNIQSLKDGGLSRYPGLQEYLPENWHQKSICTMNNGKIRFSSRVNELILVLPRVIRYLAQID